MAKKKRSAPSKTCPNCQAAQHVASKTCRMCGYVFSPAVEKPKRTTVTTRTRTENPLDAAIDYINAAGGMDKARKMLDTIDAIKKLK